MVDRGHDVSRFDEILALGYVNHNPFAERGPEGVKKVFGAIIAGMPDLKVFAEDVFSSADGTRVVGRYRYVGTHTGSFLGYPATGNAFAMRSIDSGRNMEFYFCPDCGTAVFWYPEFLPDHVGVAFGTFADPLLWPTISVWEMTRHPWVMFDHRSIGLPTNHSRRQHP
jgi:hypothetical protein